MQPRQAPALIITLGDRLGCFLHAFIQVSVSFVRYAVDTDMTLSRKFPTMQFLRDTADLDMHHVVATVETYDCVLPLLHFFLSVKNVLSGAATKSANQFLVLLGASADVPPDLLRQVTGSLGDPTLVHAAAFGWFHRAGLFWGLDHTAECL